MFRLRFRRKKSKKALLDASFKKLEKEANQTFQCCNIYPKHLGGLKYESMASVDPNADLWQKEENGKYYYLNQWEAETNTLVPYYPLPEVIEIGADYVARMLTCPYVKLKALKVGIWAHLQQWIPFLVLGLSIICLLIFGGSGE